MTASVKSSKRPYGEYRIPWRTYTGHRNKRGECVVHVIDGKGDSALLPLRLDLAQHSPTGFEWGYSGSGPAQLALAILGDVFSREIALRHHQQFKFKVIARLDRDRPWKLTEQEIIGHIRDMETTNRGE